MLDEFDTVEASEEKEDAQERGGATNPKGKPWAPAEAGDAASIYREQS
jgi:hypothetical protein